MLIVQSVHEGYAVTLNVCKHNEGEQCTMRKYATQRLIAKDVPVHLKGLFEGQNLRFRGRGSRIKAVDTECRYEQMPGYLKIWPVEAVAVEQVYAEAA